MGRYPPETLISAKKSGSIPTRDTHFSKNEWVNTHSRLRIWAKRVGANPLEALISAKMSGCKPTRIDYFDLNEWVYPLCKITYNEKKLPLNRKFSCFIGFLTHSIESFCKKRGGSDLPKKYILLKTSGQSPCTYNVCKIKRKIFYFLKK